MKQIAKFIKQFLFIGIVIFVATFLEIFWSMGNFSDAISSHCLGCSFFEDALVLSLVFTILLTVPFFIITLITSKLIRISIQFLLLIIVWFFLSYSIFVARESSWSTYLFKSELFYTFSNSILPIIVLSISVILILNYERKIITRHPRT